jgi:divalent metal cation (Fe/Co/Zn/Cd) transporter
MPTEELVNKIRDIVYEEARELRVNDFRARSISHRVRNRLDVKEVQHKLSSTLITKIRDIVHDEAGAYLTGEGFTHKVRSPYTESEEIAHELCWAVRRRLFELSKEL